MTLVRKSKLNQLLLELKPGTVATSKWLSYMGYYPQLLNVYRKHKWLERIGKEAFIRFGDKINYLGGLHTLQNQSNLSIHVGGKSALSLLGISHFLALGDEYVHLFLFSDEKVPKWFYKYNWGVNFKWHYTSFLPKDIGLIDYKFETLSIKISSPLRAMLECLYLAPQQMDLFECYNILESMNNLNPNTVQQMLEQCSSYKVKRLFLYFAEKSGHSWFNHLNLSNIDIGKGKKSLVKKGLYIKKYMITVPIEFMND